MPLVVWLADIGESNRTRVGAKAANLALVSSLGLEVPAAFCLTTEAYELFVRENQLAEAVERARQQEGSAEQTGFLQSAFRQGRLPAKAHRELADAYRELGRGQGGEARVAVRSSATAEDLVEVSSAGQYVTLLNVRGLEQLETAVIECWTSLWSPQAAAYRRRQGLPSSAAMAVLVQEMVPAEAAGVAFSHGPGSGGHDVLIEAVRGLGEALVSGQVQPDRYTASRETGDEAAPLVPGRQGTRAVLSDAGGLAAVDVAEAERGQRVLSAEQVRGIARAVMKLEVHFGQAQDMEWAWAGDRLYVLQSRPITAREDSFFNTPLPEDDRVWTSGFLNERFPVPVSPLGWTLINELLERLAFREPLRYLGLAGAENLTLTRLYHGHPYVNLFVFQTLYKVFPDRLLPEDAYRYFPQGRTELRHDVGYPRSLVDPRFLWSMLRHFVPDPTSWSPWHNYRRWGRFAEEHARRHTALAQETTSLIGRDASAGELWEVIGRLQELNQELLALHRWTLTCTDVVYSLQRRLVRSWAKDVGALEASIVLVTGLPNRSAEMDRAVHHLAALDENSAAFKVEMDAFFQSYGHRSLYLDIYHPPLSARPEQVREWVSKVRAESTRAPVPGSALAEQMELLRSSIQQGWSGRLKWWTLRHLLSLTREYMPLREDQRYAWQKVLALQRELFLAIGARMVRAGALENLEQVFFLTKSEVAVWVKDGGHQEFARVAAGREHEFQRLTAEHQAAPQRSYPPFLRGNRPLVEHPGAAGTVLQGHGVSPGRGRGRVLILHSAAELSRVKAGDVLVAPGVDSAWTPVFGLLNGLVLEHGGQLSHAAVIAREYGLPAVAGIEGVASILRDGEPVLVDGTLGVVERAGAAEAT